MRFLRILEHHHSGKLRPHEHTSYMPLFMLLAAVGLMLSVYTTYAYDRPGPMAGTTGLSGTMPATPPSVGANITLPLPEAHFSTSPITISGTCPKNLLVQIYKNEIFAGSAVCSEQGTFSLEADLMYGKNILIARVYDDLNQPGPDSREVSVYYDALFPQGAFGTALDFGGAQLLLNTDAVFRGTFPKEELVMPISILGGQAPYAVNVQWGDSTNKVIPRANNGDFNATHVFDKAGTYQVSVQATDAQGRVAFITVAAIVNGQPDPVAVGTTQAGSGATSVPAQLLALWPLYTSLVAIVISFWLGERREKRLLNPRARHAYQ